MALIGQGGRITSIPDYGEKLCVGCEHWQGGRDVTNMGMGACSRSNQGAMCVIKRSITYPNQPCSCPSSKFEKWHLLK